MCIYGYERHIYRGRGPTTPGMHIYIYIHMCVSVHQGRPWMDVYLHARMPRVCPPSRAAPAPYAPARVAWADPGRVTYMYIYIYGVGPRTHIYINIYIYVYIHSCRGGPPDTYIITRGVGPRPYIHIYTYIHIHACRGGPLATYKYICIYIHSCRDGPPAIYTYIYIHTPGVGPRPYIHIYTHMNIRAYIHTCMPGWAPGHIHTYTWGGPLAIYTYI